MPMYPGGASKTSEGTDGESDFDARHSMPSFAVQRALPGGEAAVRPSRKKPGPSVVW